MRLGFLLFALLLPIGLFSAPSSAQVNQRGADALEEEARQAFGLWNVMLSVTSPGAVLHIADIDAAPAGESYRVVLSDIIYDAPNSDVTFRLERVELMARPLGDGLYDLELAGAFGPVLLGQGGGASEARLVFDAPSYSGRVSTRLANHLSTAMSAKRVRLRFGGADFTLHDVSNSVTYSQDTPDVITQLGRLSAAQLSLTNSGTNLFFSESIVGETEYRTYDLAARLRALEELAELEPEERLEQAGLAANLNPAIFAATYKATFVTLGTGAEFLSLESLVTGGTLSRSDSGLSVIDFHVTFEKLEATSLLLSITNSGPALVPKNGRIQGRIERLPYSAILQLITVTPEDSASEFSESDREILEALSNAGSIMVIDEFTLSSETSSLSARGKLSGSAESALGSIGEASAQITGVAALTDAALGLLESPYPNMQELGHMLAAALGTLSVLSSGPQAPKPTAEDALAFELKMESNGALTVNGTPLLPPQPQQ